MVRPIRRAVASATLPARSSWSRRRPSWSTARSIHCCAPGKSPIDSSSTSGGTAIAPSAVRASGIVTGTGTSGTSHSPDRRTSSPPPDTTTNAAPAS